MLDNIKSYNICEIRIPEEKEKGGEKEIFEVTMIKKFPQLVVIRLHIQEVQSIKQNKYIFLKKGKEEKERVSKPTLRHIKFKLQGEK